MGQFPKPSLPSLTLACLDLIMIDTDATNSRIWPSALHFISVLYAYTYIYAEESHVIIFNRSNISHFILLVAGFKMRSCIIIVLVTQYKSIFCSITYNIVACFI